MATMANQVKAIRKMTGDSPLETTMTDATLNTTEETITPGDINLFAEGQVWEFDDGTDTGAEQVLIKQVDATTVEAKRGHDGTTAASHTQNVAMLLAPRFPFDTVKEAVTLAIDSDLFDHDVYDIAEHQVTSSTTTNTYNVPTSSCERFLRITQQVPNSGSAPVKVRGWHFVENADTAIAANGAYAHIWENQGIAGADVYYVECAHRYTLATLSAQVERIVQNKAAAHLLKWKEVPRLAGPTNQGDRSVRTLDHARHSGTFEDVYERLVRQESARIKRLYGGDERRFRRFSRSLP